MAAPRINHGQNESLPTIHGYVYNLAQRLPHVQVRSVGPHGILRLDSQRPSMTFLCLFILHNFHMDFKCFS